MNSTPQNRLLSLLVLSTAAATAAAQGTFAQYGEVVHAVGDPVSAAAPGVTPAPGATIFATSNFDAPLMDQNGTILYRARMTGGGSTAVDDRAYFMGRVNGDLRMVVRAGDQAPGCPLGTLLRNSSATSGSAGLLAPARISPFGEFLYFQSSLYDPVTPANTPATADTALFWGPASSLQLLAREGDPVPFLGTGEVYGPFLGFSLQNNCINASGRVLFEVQLLGGTSTTANDGCLVSGPLGGLAIVSREGDVFPGGEVVIPVSGTTQLSFIHQINEVGQVLHELRFAIALPSTATTANDHALAVWTPGFGDTIIAREGQQAPGLPAGVLFATPTFGWNPSLSGCSFTKSGNTMLQTSLDGGGTVPSVDDVAVYYGGASGWTLIMRRGSACPGLVNGELFGSLGATSMACNDAGQVAFISSLTGPLVTTANDSALWFGSIGNLQMLAREGDAVPGMTGWMFQQISAGTNSPQLNERGQLLTQLGVTDGTNFKSVLFGWTPELGLHVLTEINGTSTFTTALGTGVPQSLSSNAGFNSGDSSQSHFNTNGDFVYKPGFPAPMVAAIVRGHVGSMISEPSGVPVAGGVQNFHINCGASHAFEWHWVIASGSGTRPGFPSPLGPQMIPLNFDGWTQLSIDLADTAVWNNTLWFTDAEGKSSASFVLPPGFPGFLGLTLHHAAVVFNNSLVSTFVTEPSAVKVY
jgi:hypothetical protein